jgi:hypothetical protein
LRSRITAITDREFPPDMALDAWSSMSVDSVTLGTVRPVSRRFLSGVIRTFGPERFEQFWRSSAPVEIAFRQAFGVSLGSWTASWAQDEWQAALGARWAPRDFRLGTTLHWSWIPLIAVWSALALLVAMRVAERRHA